MYTATHDCTIHSVEKRRRVRCALRAVSSYGNNGLGELKGGLIALMALLALNFFGKPSPRTVSLGKTRPSSSQDDK